MAAKRNRSHRTALVLLCLFLGRSWEAEAGQIRYSVPEELEKGSFVGNISKDLGLEPRKLAERGVRIVSRGRTQLFALNPRSGSLVTADRIDREELCAQSARCLVNFNILVEDRVKLFGIEIEVTDINDNAPKFPTENVDVKINENVAPGMRFPLLEAVDPDVGVNSLQSYQLSSNKHFSLAVQSHANGVKYPELVLEHALDREEEAVHHLVLTALDGGDPLLSGTVLISVTVFDTNDNAPVFTLPEYRVSVLENLPVGTQLLTVTATDRDEGANGEVTYSFRKSSDTQLLKFQLNKNTGEIKLSENLDYEETDFYELEIQAEDGGAYLAMAKVLITVEDVNDNSPEVTITSLFSPLMEDSPMGTVIALLNVHDPDSGQNGQVTCSISENLPFKLEKSIDGYYRLLTHRTLDREQVSSYNITVTATDGGNPPLLTETHFTLQVADINDNPPTFSHSSYFTYILENNPRGASIFSVTALDPDSKENAQVIYSLAEDTFQGAPLSSYISINSDTGVLYALRSFDYEQFRNLQIQVIATDSGDPPLSSNVSLSIFVLDQNDNAPEILYPTLPTDGSTGVELAPRSAEPGYLVTKVVAVDRDSGQNAWLSYRLLKASEPGLFAVGLHTGEVRTARALLDRDALKQSLVVAVQDHGQPPLSATVTLTVAVADSIPDVLADLGSIRTPGDPDDSDLTLYLVVAVAAVSCVFLAFVIVLLALRLRRWHASRLLQASGGGLVGVPASHFVGVDGVRAFLQTYSHEVSLTADSRESHVIFPQPNYADTLISQESCEKKDPLSLLDDSKFPVEDTLLVPILEDAHPGMVVALFKTQDQDSGQNGEVTCNLSRGIPFKIHSSSNNFYKLVTDGPLDREHTPEYNVTITATDRGKPPLSSSITITLHITDVNDNAPVFHQASYVVHVAENNPPGASIAQVSASDPDLGPNGRVSYSIVASDLEPRALASYVSVSAQSGVVFAQRAFDHEQLRAFELTLQARDQGSPALSANVSLRVLVDDRNDNAPRVLYPALGPDGSALFDTVPRAAQPGYLVTKVVAVDADSGHNAWLSYHVLQASEPGLFSLGLRTGEVRTARALGDRDAARQRLLVAVRDGGQPPLSATATLLLVFADSLQEVLPDVSDRLAPSDPQAELQFYLVVALALISVLFLLAVILAVALRLRSSSSPAARGCFGSALCSESGPEIPPNYSEGTLPYAYNLCVPGDQTNPEFNFLTSVDHFPATQDILNKDSPSGLLTSILIPNVETDKKTFKQQAPPNTDWRFSQAQRPGTSGSQNGDETGTWPNNQFDTEMLQAMILASASEAADGSSTLGGGAGTMGLSARYGPQFTLQHVPDYRQNVYIPGSNATLTNAAGKRDGKAPAGGNGNKKKSGKKEKK
ncbi:protocadherin gamma-A10 isoform X1 [Ursus americanus]|uniref:protocadherin gamma-A10 isoform X1 n=1 Tax=Ursus americanus TaxID=9643 RepID=UPI001E67B0AA|nr:protocadherin gamma-A10 isoform X1 [Ursus americanus]